jgi:hypothetical protein
MTGSENMPDGPQGPVISVYREGRDECIEHSAGPGEDVCQMFDITHPPSQLEPNNSVFSIQ